jgi:hypothetical protein
LRSQRAKEAESSEPQFFSWPPPFWIRKVDDLFFRSAVKSYISMFQGDFKGFVKNAAAASQGAADRRRTGSPIKKGLRFQKP